MDKDKKLISMDLYKADTMNDPKNTTSPKKRFSRLKSVLLSILIIIFLATVGMLYVFFTPTSFIVIDVGASINLKVNRWNKIIDVSSLNTKGETILSISKVKYKNIEDGLTLILSNAEEENYINALSSNEQKKQVSVFISGNHLDLSSFSNVAQSRKLDLQLNQSGTDN